MGSFFHLYNAHEERPARWFLKGPVMPDGRQIDPRIFTRGEPVSAAEPLYIPLRREGEPLDFTLADFGMPVLLSSFTDALVGVAGRDIQRFRARIEGDDDSYDVINLLRVVDCLDEKHSDVTRWTEHAGLPDMVGEYLTVTSTSILPALERSRFFARVVGSRRS